MTATEVMPSIVMGMLLFVGSSITDEIVWTMVSFCMSIWKSLSILNSKNSHRTPIVMEKQNAANATYTGESVNLIFAFRLRMSISEKPTAAHRKPFVVCSIVSQFGYWIK